MKKRFSIVFFTFSVLFFIVTSNTAANEDSYKPNEDHQPLILDFEDLSIHFLELGNKYTGDSVYIQYNDIDIIIDAGSKQDSATTIIAYIDNYIQDNKLEYVIATHPHEDHIAGFSSSNTVTGILDYYEIGTIIDFTDTGRTSATVNNYRAARERAMEKGATHYTALQCFNEEGDAQRIYDLGGGVKLEILYNYYYEYPSSNENNNSVCLKIIQGEYQYIFTGDLEKDGEDRLVAYYEENYDGGLGKCVLYKGGHHGSKTSSNENLMNAILPEYICVCSCVGTSQYRASPENIFPSQDFIDRVAPYTDKIYITTQVTDYSNNQYMPFNGNIVFLVRDDNFSINCSNNNLKLKDTEWFQKNRIMPDAWKPEEPLELQELLSVPES